jgi:broad specificity phosphatase PhoE
MQERQSRGFTFYMIRHGASCANLASLSKRPDVASQYTDPELTAEGRRLTRALRPYAHKALPKPIVVGASTLLRTQQTAHFLLNPKKLFIIPYINEMGRESQESTALPSVLQESVLGEQLGDHKVVASKDETYLQGAPAVSEQAQVGAFLEWLGHHVDAITQSQTKTLVLFSHYQFLASLIKKATGKPARTIRNCEMFRFRAVLRNGTAVITSVRRIPYGPDRLLEWDMASQSRDHGCRDSVGI